MKKLLLVLVLSFNLLPKALAEVKTIAYDGKEIYIHTQKDHTTLIAFPEIINQVIRGWGADSYVIQRKKNNPKVLELMPTDTEPAEMTISGISGEEYSLRFLKSGECYSKVTILPMAQAKPDELGSHELILKTPQIQIEKKDSKIEKKVQSPSDKGIPDSLNTKMTLKGNNLPLKIYFSMISQVTGLNVITTPEIDSQKTSINLEKIEVWRALKSLLYKFGYGFKVSQDDLIITESETRIFNISVPAVDQSFRDETSNESFASSNNNNNTSTTNQQSQDIKVGTKIYYENTSPKLSLWTDLENNIKSIITPQRGSYSLNRTSGSIIVTDKPQVLDKIGDLVSMINESLSRQEGFEIQIIEVTLSSDHEEGIDWNTIAKGVAGLNNITASTNFTAQGFLKGQLLSVSATGPNSTSGTAKAGVSMILKALDSMGAVNVVSKPSITVTNMFPCVIQEITSIPYISGTGQTIGNNVTQSNVTTSQVSDGLTMRLEAKIEDKKTVLNISAALNTLDSMTSVPAGNGLTIQEPQVSTKSITTNVGVEIGQTLILGGLISKTQTHQQQGIPYLEKIPLLGKAFQYKGQSSQKTELVIIITPKTVIRNM
ncbi:MAG: secretin N-terminal domain-containing protein [Candidatus Omnitrophica bacterium]|nr:secretin N-terminal domain-containing protein [Candidatus Omnitrophota bacterium]